MRLDRLEERRAEGWRREGRLLLPRAGAGRHALLSTAPSRRLAAAAELQGGADRLLLLPALLSPRLPSWLRWEREEKRKGSTLEGEEEAAAGPGRSCRCCAVHAWT